MMEHCAVDSSRASNRKVPPFDTDFTGFSTPASEIRFSGKGVVGGNFSTYLIV